MECSLVKTEARPPPSTRPSIRIRSDFWKPWPAHCQRHFLFSTSDTRRVSSCPYKKKQKKQNKRQPPRGNRVIVHRVRRRVVALPQQVRGADRIYWSTSRQILQTRGAWTSWAIWGQARGGGLRWWAIAASSSVVAWHLALFTAVERGVVEEGAALTVPLGPFKVLVPLGARHRLGVLLLCWQQETPQRGTVLRGKAAFQDDKSA